MTDQTKATRRDEVLFAFHRECPRPTVQQIIDWTGQYPEFADDIREHAAIRRSWDGLQDDAVSEADDLLIARGRSRALNAIYNAQVAANATSAPSTFDQMLSSAGTTTPQLARELDIDRSILADLFRGRMRPPVGPRLVHALLRQLRTTLDDFNLALNFALAGPSVGHAKADKTPTVVQRSYEEIIQSSAMSPERKSHWLEEI